MSNFRTGSVNPGGEVVLAGVQLALRPRRVLGPRPNGRALALREVAEQFGLLDFICSWAAIASARDLPV
ncbi:hypothetical protein ABT237_17155 [Streptomyces sp. NPDC001581]|uniref:hypothetical protein n=1 Tax=Streptomyces sp. NPDC001581 TaxID=3154386 RepID=UPI0033271D3F